MLLIAISGNQLKLVEKALAYPIYFADYLFLFAEANIEQTRVIQAYLDTFCMASGENVNKEKTHLFCSRNMNPNVEAEISNETSFPTVADLGKYLGIPLHHHRGNQRTFQFLEEKLNCSLRKWRANFLSLAGRITLTKVVLNSIPVYYMQTNLLPNSVCERIDKISRDFI